jgi:hypothetical protein
MDVMTEIRIVPPEDTEVKFSAHGKVNRFTGVVKNILRKTHRINFGWIYIARPAI